MSSSRRPAARRVSLAFVVFNFLFASGTAPAWCDPGEQLHEPTSLPVRRTSSPISQENDVLLVMPAATAQGSEVSETLKEVHGTVIETIGEGPMTIFKIKCEKGKLLETQKKLSQDKNFSIVECNYKFKINAAGSSPVNDPYFPNEWHLAAVNAVKAWQVNQGGQFYIGVLDTGVSTGNQDLSGKVTQGYDTVNNRNGQSPVGPHGTWVSTTAAAVTNNGFDTAAVARNALIFPIVVANSDGTVDESAVIKGIYYCGKLGVKIINISANADTPYTFANKRVHPALHTYLQWFHDTKGGLVFNAAGNDGSVDSSPRLSYLIVCSAINTSYSLADFSTYGTPVWFTAPGVSIFCSGPDGKVASLSGTSFSTPICAAVAAMVWGANPRLTNTQVEQILVQTCYKAGTYNWTPWYGFGMPNAQAAVNKATGH